jgi:hypothetical protein
VVDESRERNTERLVEVFTELGTPDSPALRMALRAWVAFTEETLISLLVERDTPPADVVRFLVGTLDGVVASAGGLDL